MNLVRCHKCGAMVISAQGFLQQIIDEIDECNQKAHKASKLEKGVYIKQAAGYTAMFKGFMHNLTKSEEAERNKEKFILKELRDYVVERGLISENELKKIWEIGTSRSEARKAEADREMQRVYGEFETVCNRTKASPTEAKALRNC